VDHVDLLRGIYGGRRWILASDVLAGATRQLVALRDVGVEDVFVVAGSRGTGATPTDVGTVVLGLEAGELMEAIHGFDEALGALPAAVLAAVDAFDPRRRAHVIAPLFSHCTRAADRPVWGARRASWRALEDKMVVDEIWRAAGVPQAPSAVVPAEPSALRSAGTALDAGYGTVWVADNRRGWHGGATGLRWVRSDAQAAAAAAFMADRADRVRVMPFLDGVPCSIHGVVLPRTTLAFRPCEMVVLRRAGRSELCYAGTATLWDPPPVDRAELRTHVRRVGEHLRSAVGYRGAFSIDGVMTADGFRPTELNPRFGAALGLLAAVADIPLYLVHMAAVEGVDVDWPETELEGVVVAAADAARRAGCHVPVAHPLEERTLGVRYVDGAVEPVDTSQAQVTLQCGPSPLGGFVRLELASDAVAPGSAVAPLVADVLMWADERIGRGLGRLEPAPDVRQSG
jgi:hypothetical protein